MRSSGENRKSFSRRIQEIASRVTRRIITGDSDHLAQIVDPLHPGYAQAREPVVEYKGPGYIAITRIGAHPALCDDIAAIIYAIGRSIVPAEYWAQIDKGIVGGA